MRVVGSRVLAGLVLALMSASVVFAYEMDDTVPEVTDRVARISFLRGDVQIRRDGSQDWEKAELNLPIVEGDEIAVEDGGRLEIQFSKDVHLRVDEATVVTIGQLSDSGIALGVTRGIVSVRLRKLDTDREFFEIDGPGTTVAIQKSGAYRFDAGGDGSSEVNIGVTSGGEARIYSANSGFSIKSGRAAKVYIDGDRSGEWDMTDASRFNDAFTAWADDRDSVVEKAIGGAYYDKYYDQDIYGAEDLNSYGDWEYTSDYGYIWRPYQRSISVYNDWSPYRYGSWRWVPPFGWTWVNAEPWGWATSHYGRWVWYRNRWVWTPYGYYRTNRSWWYPALVVVQVVNRNICWYPLGWGRRYNNYNHYYHDYLGNRDRRRRDRDRDWDGRGRDSNRDVAVTPSPTPGNPVADKIRPQTRGKVVPADSPGFRIGAGAADPALPPGAVISLPSDDFGWGRKIPTKAPPEVARDILAKKGDSDSAPVRLPAYESVRPKLSKEVSSTPPKLIGRGNLGVRVGASERAVDVPLDRELHRSRILGDRQPIPPPPAETTRPSEGNPRRPIGAVERPPVSRPQVEERKEKRSDEVTKGVPRIGNQPRPDVPRNDQAPAYKLPPRESKTPPQTEAPRREPAAPRQETPRPEPPVRRDPPRQEEKPRNDPPSRRETPPARQDPPQRKQPDPPKQERPAPKNDAGPTRKREPIT